MLVVSVCLFLWWNLNEDGYMGYFLRVLDLVVYGVIFLYLFYDWKCFYYFVWFFYYYIVIIFYVFYNVKYK